MMESMRASLTWLPRDGAIYREGSFCRRQFQFVASVQRKCCPDV